VAGDGLGSPATYATGTRIIGIAARAESRRGEWSDRSAIMAWYGEPSGQSGQRP